LKNNDPLEREYLNRGRNIISPEAFFQNSFTGG